jgi:hypothetical protein
MAATSGETEPEPYNACLARNRFSGRGVRGLFPQAIGCTWHPMTNSQATFDSIVRDPRYQKNLDWGEARPGHPEGTVRAHIDELEHNLELLRPKLETDDFWKLKLLIHTHDSFKSEVKSGVAITDPKSHASLARDFLAEFCDDRDLLAMVQYHDEPFALWRQGQGKGKCNAARLTALLQNVQDWNLFLAFNIIDGCTEGKGREPLVWLFEQVADKIQTTFSATDIL